MSSSPHHIRVRQRGRYGIRALVEGEPPVADEMMLDKLVLRIPGVIRWHGTEVSPERAAALLHGYRELLEARLTTALGRWTAPSQGKAGFTSSLQPGCTTITGARLAVRWDVDEVRFSLSLKLNPIRTLVHLWPRIGPSSDAESQLREMQRDDFWGTSGTPMKAGTLDDNDNAVATLDGILALLGSTYPQRFIETFENQLRRWSIEAVAPASSGFTHDLSEPDPRALLGDQSVTLNWSQLVISSAELFFERRHADAIALMHRVAAHVHAAHGNAEWRSYGVEQDFGGRLGKSMTVGISPTEDIRQICYAKTNTRVRVEIRYLRKVRASLRVDANRPARPLFDLFAALQSDAASRVDWKTFCKMCVEPPHAMLTEVSQMMALIAECARGAGVPAKPVFTALLTARSIAEDDSGDFPRRLMKRLEAAGLIDRQSLVRRVRPGERRRHRLTPAYFQIVGQLQQAFEQ